MNHVASGQQARTSWAAHGLHIVIIQLHAVVREFVKGGRWNLCRSMERYVVPTQVICHHHEYVWAPCGGRSGYGDEAKETQTHDRLPTEGKWTECRVSGTSDSKQDRVADRRCLANRHHQCIRGTHRFRRGSRQGSHQNRRQCRKRQQSKPHTGFRSLGSSDILTQAPQCSRYPWRQKCKGR